MAGVPATPEQMEALLSYMRAHQDLARGRLIQSLEGRLRARRLWSELTTFLNGLGGSLKTTKQWQRVWADKKYSAKKAKAAANRSIVATGGGPPSAPPLKGVDSAVADIMGDNYRLPMSDAYVDAFAEYDENLNPNLPPRAATPSTSLGSQVSMSILDTDLELPICLMEMEVAAPEEEGHATYSFITSPTYSPAGDCDLPASTSRSDVVANPARHNPLISSTLRGQNLPASTSRSGDLHASPVRHTPPISSPARDRDLPATTSRSGSMHAEPAAQGMRPQPAAAASTTRIRRSANRQSQRFRPDARARIIQLEEQKMEELRSLRRSVENLTEAVSAIVVEMRRLFPDRI